MYNQYMHIVQDQEPKRGECCNLFRVACKILITLSFYHIICNAIEVHHSLMQSPVEQQKKLYAINYSYSTGQRAKKRRVLQSI